MRSQPWTTKPPQGWAIDADAPLARQLAGFWALNEGAGVPAEAATGALAASNSATWQADIVGPVLLFNGSSQYVNIGPLPQLDVAGGPITLAACCRPAAGGRRQDVIGGYQAGGSYAGYALSINYSGSSSLALYANAWVGCQDYAIADGAWHAYAASQESTGTGGAKFYRDGLPLGTPQTCPSWAGAWSGSRWLGSDSGGGDYFDGPIGWVGIWSRALSPAEHAAIGASPDAIWPLLYLPRRRRAPYSSGAPIFTGQSSGGCVVGGFALPAAIFPGMSSGGAVSGGSAAPSAAWTMASLGGAVAGGDAQGTAVGTHTGESSGGAVGGGDANPSASWVAASAGGAVAGGSADPAATFVATAAGGPVAGGSAQGTSGATYIGESSGGPVGGGSANPSASWVAASSGGAIAGGSASPAASFVATAAGGAIAGGLSSPAITFVAPSSGGAVAGGSADGRIGVLSGESSGGAVAGGYAAPSATFSGDSSGGAVVGGAADPAVTFAVVASGGAVAGGDASGHIPGQVFAGESSGGAVAGGSADGSLYAPLILYLDPTRVVEVATFGVPG